MSFVSCNPARCAGSSVLLLALAVAAAVPTQRAAAAAPFEVAAWVDHFDFAFPAADGRPLFDTETPEGWHAILEHVRETGATTILWRNCGGATMRYPSAVETWHHDPVLDKRRVPDNRAIGGWVQYGSAAPDILRTVFAWCEANNLKAGIHWPYEENHWSGWTVGGFNLEHPQYWCRTADGFAWWGRSSLAYPEVIDHKLALTDELIARKPDILFLDFWRTGAWSPAYEFVPPMVESYRQATGSAPPADPADKAWCRHVAASVTDLLRQVKARLAAAEPPGELAVGIAAIAPDFEESLVRQGADWQRWVDEGIVDVLVINYLKWDSDDPFGSTRELGRRVMQRVDGRCRVLWPVRAYDYSGFGMPSYMKATGLPQHEVARNLVQIAWEEGAGGISLECVDYNNYRPETRQAMRELLSGKCRFVRE